MRPEVTPQYAAVVKGSHKELIRFTLRERDGTVLLELPVIGYSLACDGTAALYTTGSITVIDEDGELIPGERTWGDNTTFGQTTVVFDQSGMTFGPYVRTQLEGVLSPLTGNEVLVQHGVVTDYSETGGDVITWVNIGVLRLKKLTSATSMSEGGVQINIQIEDRAGIIAQNQWTGNYNLKKLEQYHTSIKKIAQNRMPGVVFLDNSTSVAKHGLIILGQDDSSDPWQDMVYLARKINHHVFFDGLGRCVLEPLPALVAREVDVIVEGGETGQLWQSEKGYDIDDTYNGVVLTCSAFKKPKKIIIWDTDPLSDTYYLGPFGKKPFAATDDTHTKSADAYAYADALLRQKLQQTETISMTITPNMGLMPGDVLAVRDPELKVYKLYRLDNWERSGDTSAPGEMTISVTRQIA